MCSVGYIRLPFRNFTMWCPVGRKDHSLVSSFQSVICSTGTTLDINPESHMGKRLYDGYCVLLQINEENVHENYSQEQKKTWQNNMFAINVPNVLIGYCTMNKLPLFVPDAELCRWSWYEFWSYLQNNGDEEYNEFENYSPPFICYDQGTAISVITVSSATNVDYRNAVMMTIDLMATLAWTVVPQNITFLQDGYLVFRCDNTTCLWWKVVPSCY